MKNMFTGKQNVINLTIYQLFNRKQQESHSHMFLVTPTDKRHEITH